MSKIQNLFIQELIQLDWIPILKYQNFNISFYLNSHFYDFLILLRGLIASSRLL